MTGILSAGLGIRLAALLDVSNAPCSSHGICLYWNADGVAADIARYTGKDPTAGQDAKRLAMVMSLDPRYFPEELYTSKERK